MGAETSRNKKKKTVVISHPSALIYKRAGKIKKDLNFFIFFFVLESQLCSLGSYKS